MAFKSSPSFLKRQKEQARQAKAKEKNQRREQRQKDKANRPDGSEDPDIAGIVPGPQPKEDEDEGGATP